MTKVIRFCVAVLYARHRDVDCGWFIMSDDNCSNTHESFLSEVAAARFMRLHNGRFLAR